MKSCGLVSFFFAWALWAGEGVTDVFHGPKEFQESEVKAEMDANWQASTGVQKINSLEIQWAPDRSVIRGTSKQIQMEAQTIRNSLKAFPLLAPLENLVQTAEGGTVLDLTNLLSAIEKKLPQNCYNCFALCLCVMKKQTRTMNANDLMLALNQTHEKKKEKHLGPGSVVVLRENYQNKDPYHAYIWLSPTLALEKRGSGALLIRPQDEIEKEYRSLASLERKSFKLMQGKKMPSLSSPIKMEYWVKK